MAEGQRDISRLIADWGNGDEQALPNLISAVYPQLREIARQHLRRWHPGKTLESAAVANEAYLKLRRAGAIRCENRIHFLALCTQIMRRILVDHARAGMRPGKAGFTDRIPLDEIVLGVQGGGVDILALNEALESLAELDARKARVVELRYFGGLSIEETAEVLSITPARVKRDWQAARLWLYSMLTDRPSEAG